MEAGSLSELKRALRARVADRRAALAPTERSRLSARAVERLLALPEVQAGRVVAGYAAASGEVDPAPALEALRARGVEIVLPRVGASSPRLRFHVVPAGVLLGRGRLGVPEPAAEAPERSIDGIDVFVVPGLAFDAAGRRLGRGAGHYDEVGALVRAGGRGRLVGLAFDFQIVDVCPAGAGDVAMDFVVTDERVLGPRGA